MAEQSATPGKIPYAEKKRQFELHYEVQLQDINTMRNTRLEQMRRLTSLKDHHTPIEKAPSYTEREVAKLERSLTDNVK